MQEENNQKGYFETLNYYVMWIGSDAERDLKDDPNWVNAQKEAKDRGFLTLYLKTELVNYYEKFGAKYIKNIGKNEQLFKINVI